MKHPQVVISEALGYPKGFASDAANPILVAIEEAGYAIVPKEPTQTMLCAGHDSAERVANRSIHQPIAPAMWAAMIAKADK